MVNTFGRNSQRERASWAGVGLEQIVIAQIIINGGGKWDYCSDWNEHDQSLEFFLVQSLAHTFPKTILQSADSLVEAFIIQIPKLLKSFSLVKKWLNWYKCNYMIWWIQNGEFPRVTVWIEHSVFFLCSCYFCSHPMVLYVLVVSRNAFRSVLLLFIANLFSILILNYLSSVCCRMYG